MADPGDEQQFGHDHPTGRGLVENPALPENIGHVELLDIPGRWGRTDAYGRGRQQFTAQHMA